jgi:uncharacterized protein YaaN involved in tellurite resistance
MARDIDLKLEEQSSHADGFTQMVRLSEADIKYAQEFSQRIDVTDTLTILKYGSLAQKHVSDFTDASLADVPAHDYEEITADLKKLQRRIASFEREILTSADLYADQEKAFSAYKTIYERCVSAVNEATRRLDIHRSSLLRHMKRLNNHYDKCMLYLREYDMYIHAGELALKRCRSQNLNDLLKRAKQTGLQEDALNAKDYDQACKRLEKRLSDLSLSRQLPLQLCTQIRMMQGTDVVLSDTLQSLANNSFPLWKSRMILALGLGEKKVFDEEIIKETDRSLSDTISAVLKSFQTSKQKQRTNLLGGLK